MDSSSNRYAPRLPQQETKSSEKLLALTDTILGPEELLKTGFAKGPFIAAMFWSLFGPCFRAMIKQVCWHSRLSKAYRAYPRHEDKARLTETRIYIILLLGVAVGHCGAFWTCKSIAVCQSCASFGKKVTAESKTLALDSKKWSSQLRWKIDGQTSPNWSTCVMRRPFCVNFSVQR